MGFMLSSKEKCVSYRGIHYMAFSYFAEDNVIHCLSYKYMTGNVSTNNAFSAQKLDLIQVKSLFNEKSHH